MNVQHVSRSRWGRLLTVLGVCGVSFFLHGSAPAVSLMESRNFVAAREMVAGGSWLIPTMNGELRLAKPPLPTWAVAGLQQLTGPTDDLGILRWPAALAATLLVLFFWGLVRELTRTLPGEAADPGRTAWLAALVLASSLLVVTTGREGQWDIFANSLMVGGVWLLVRGWQRPRHGWPSLLGAGLLIGLAILSKGPVPLYGLLLPFLLAYLIRQPQHRGLVARQGWGTVAAAVVALVVGGSWPAYIWLKVAPAALRVARIETASWGNRHVQPPWYYWSFFAFTGLWALVTLAALVKPYAQRRASRYIPYVVALGWLVAGLVLLSLVPEKKERYMLPLMPPLALLVAGLLRYWESLSRPEWFRPDLLLVRAWGILLALVCVALPVAMAVLGLPGFGVGSARFGAAVVAFGGLAAWIVWQGVRPVRPVMLMAGTLTVMGTLLSLLMPVYPVWESRRDTPGLSHVQDMRRLPAVAGVASWRSLDTLHVKQVWGAGRAVPVWYPTLDSLVQLRQPVVVFSGSPAVVKLPAAWSQFVRVQVVDSFYLGRDQESGRWFVSRLDPI